MGTDSESESNLYVLSALFDNDEEEKDRSPGLEEIVGLEVI